MDPWNEMAEAEVSARRAIFRTWDANNLMRSFGLAFMPNVGSLTEKRSRLQEPARTPARRKPTRSQSPWRLSGIYAPFLKHPPVGPQCLPCLLSTLQARSWTAKARRIEHLRQIFHAAQKFLAHSRHNHPGPAVRTRPRVLQMRWHPAQAASIHHKSRG